MTRPGDIRRAAHGYEPTRRRLAFTATSHRCSLSDHRRPSDASRRHPTFFPRRSAPTGLSHSQKQEPRLGSRGPSPTGWVRGWGTWGHAIQWRLVNSGAARQFLQAHKSRERPNERPMKMVTRLVSFGGKWLGTMASLIVPPPFPLPLPDKRRCSFSRFGGAVPGVSHSLPVFTGLGVNRSRSAFLEVLRPLPEVDYLVHAGKIPNHERRSLTEKASL
jgi:hypothetical protein